MRYVMLEAASGKRSPVSAEVKVVEPERRLNQFGGMRGILTFDHTWRLEAIDGGTKVIQHEEYRGLAVWFWDPSAVEAGYHKSNAALRERIVGRGP